MDNNKIAEFIKKQKVAFICSVDEDGFPNVKAMLPDSLRSAVDYLLDIKVNALEKAEIKPVLKLTFSLVKALRSLTR